MRQLAKQCRAIVDLYPATNSWRDPELRRQARPETPAAHAARSIASELSIGYRRFPVI
jgi:hypothetical protein